MDLSPEMLLSAYTQGSFPMTDRDGRTRWYTADPRGVIPLDEFHVPHTLGQLLRKNPPVYEVRIDTEFELTMRSCMIARPDGTWIVKSWCVLTSACTSLASPIVWKRGKTANWSVDFTG